MKAKSFEELVIWQKAIEIGEVIYHLADEESLKKDYKSRDQLIGTAVSISNNIVGGFEYNNKVQFRKHLFYAKSSAGQLRSQLALLVKVGKIKKEKYEIIHQELIQLSAQIKTMIIHLAK